MTLQYTLPNYYILLELTVVGADVRIFVKEGKAVIHV
jgi:hypothetical protein